MDKGWEDTFMKGQGREKLLMLLKQAQKQETYVSRAVILEIAQSMHIPVNEVYGVASFYSFLSMKPQGRYVIRVCKSLPCYLRESRMIVESVVNEIGIKPGEITADGRFSFELANCIGACDMAPAMLINDEVYGYLTPDKITKALKSYF